MLTAKFSSAGSRTWINSIRSDLSTATPVILDQCGGKLVGLARIYFDNLSRGRTGFSGRKWPAPKASTVAKREALARRGLLRAAPTMQGILTGRMQASLGYSTSTDSVRVAYDAPYARWFNVRRRMIPTVLPRVWRDALDYVVIQYFYRQIKDGKD